jgi:hypothetical protein
VLLDQHRNIEKAHQPLDSAVAGHAATLGRLYAVSVLLLLIAVALAIAHHHQRRVKPDPPDPAAPFAFNTARCPSVSRPCRPSRIPQCRCEIVSRWPACAFSRRDIDTGLAAAQER